MMRKDCENGNQGGGRLRNRAAKGRTFWQCFAVISVFAGATPFALGGSVRVFTHAVVVDDTIRLSDVAELRGFSMDEELKLRALAIAQSPSRGGSRLIHVDSVRDTLRRGKANLARVLFMGAARCTVRRPLSTQATVSEAQTTTSGLFQGQNENGQLEPLQRVSSKGSGSETLRAAIIEFFTREISPFQGRAEVVFHNAQDQVLDLTRPTYDFRIRKRGGNILGLVQLNVDLFANGEQLQTVSLVAQVSLVRQELIARRAINQGATIGANDVELVSTIHTRPAPAALNEPALVVGQRAKRFIPRGTLLEPAMYASVPLVTRGQLVTLTSVSGAIRVVTTAQAASEGLLGETIRVRTSDKSRLQLDAIVVGPGRVQIGGRIPGGVRVSRGTANRTLGGNRS